ncbi:MAG: protein kinase [Planctomycetaceae bacterium]|nr:protein kinase [Planctomycetaceae bacterium]
MGIVWRAFDPLLGRDVALKEIRTDNSDRGLRQLLRMEARMASHLEHPGIVPIYDVADDAEGNPYYAMRLVEGDRLTDAIRRLHSQTSESSEFASQRNGLLRRFCAVCQAVAYAHSRGVIHRDIKSANIALGAFDDVQVLDWGLARKDGVSVEGDTGQDEPSRARLYDTMPGTRKGTPAYMAPEQALGDVAEIGPRTDVYGLGAVLYEILTGREPFPRPDLSLKSESTADAVEAVFRQIVEEGPLSPRRVGPAVPAALEAVCMKAMARAPQSRYASPSELAADVSAWMEDRPTTAYVDPWRTRMRRWASRHRTLVASTGIGSLVLIVSLAAGIVLLNRSYASEQAAREDADQRLFASQIKVGFATWEKGQVSELNSLLERLSTNSSETETSPFEWHCLDALSRSSELNSLPGNRGAVDALLVSRDGTRLVTLSQAKAAPSVVGRSSASGKCIAEVWDLPNRRLIARSDEVPASASAAMTPDGTGLLLGGIDGIVRRCSLDDLQTFETWPEVTAPLGGPGSAISALTISPDFARVGIVRVDGSVEIYDWVAETRIASSAPMGAGGAVDSREFGIVWTANDQYLVTDRRSRGWFHALDPQAVRSVNFGEIGAACLDLSADLRELILGGSHGQVALRDVDTGKTRRTLECGREIVQAVRYSPKGSRMAAGGADGIVRVWSGVEGRLVAEFRGHRSSVRSLIWLTESTLISGGSQGEIILWDLSSPVEREIVQDLSRTVADLVELPGRGLAAVALDSDLQSEEPGEVVLLNLEDKSRIPLSLSHGESIGSVAWSPDGRWLATGTDGGSRTMAGRGEFCIWDSVSGRRVRTLGRYAGLAGVVAFSADGRHVIGVHGNVIQGSVRVRVWDTETWDSYELPDGPPSAGFISYAAISPDSHWLVMGTMSVSNPTEPGTLLVWDLRKRVWHSSGTSLAQNVTALQFSPDGQQVILSTGLLGDPAAIDGAIEIRSIPDCKQLSRLQDRGTGACYCAAMSPDQRLAAGASFDGTVRLWDLASKTIVRKVPASLTKSNEAATPANWIDFDPEGKWIAISATDAVTGKHPAGSELRIVEAATGRVASTQTISSTVFQCLFSTDGKSIALAEGDHANVSRITPQGTLEPAQSPGYPRGNPASHQGRVGAVAASSDGKWLATGGEDEEIRLWKVDEVVRDPARSIPLRLRGHSSSVCDACFSPDSRWLASVSGSLTNAAVGKSRNRELILWSTAEQKESTRLPLGDAQLCRLAFLDDERIAVAVSSPPARPGGGCEVHILGLPTLHKIARIRGPDFDSITCLAARRGGNELAFGVFGRQLFTAPTSGAEPARELGRMSQIPTAITYSPDGRTIAATGNRGELVLYAAASHQEMLSMLFHREALQCVAFSADSRQLLLGGAAPNDFGGELHLWPRRPAASPWTLPNLKEPSPLVSHAP